MDKVKEHRRLSQSVLSQISLDELIKATSAKVVYRGGRVHQISISTDSRSFNDESLFIALKGPCFNGHDFIVDVIKKGALVLVLQEDELDACRASICKQNALDGLWVLLVKDTLIACQDIAKCILNKWSGLRIGVTGSNGKTSTKEMLKAILDQHYSVLASQGNWNNQIGVPKTIFNLDLSHQCLLAELGSGKKGDIQRVSRVLSPDFGMITNVGNAHVEYLENIQGVIQEKSDIACGFHSQSKIILNADSPFYPQLSERFESSQIIPIYPETRPMFRVIKDLALEGYLLEIKSKQVHFSLMGKWNLLNLHFALKLADELGIQEDKIINGIQQINPIQLRMQSIQQNGYKIIQDCYNANPDSMKLGVKFLSDMPGDVATRKIAILGDMLELGEQSKQFHEQIGYIVSQLHIDYLFTLGKEAQCIAFSAIQFGFSDKKVYLFRKDRELIDFLKSFVKQNDILYFKASRAIGLENIIAHL